MKEEGKEGGKGEFEADYIKDIFSSFLFLEENH